jgi:hypothetical protein
MLVEPKHCQRTTQGKNNKNRQKTKANNTKKAKQKSRQKTNQKSKTTPTHFFGFAGPFPFFWGVASGQLLGLLLFLLLFCFS